ncbi:MAG: lipoprotein ABC transporter ATP-binding protein [Spirochaetes bacterium GWD1_61_31]|nr:MAG: lipoprotein ABC transporter ATP-binding protein [Spirochaetes bacterium GWB1_60_80]OHD29575.1 MAG: lipoprotein ABC transporter ATP-binding protein [Spirochaetes bacterium GWC1_61_12]OHD37480.1 MAG: lipoprotein ABC transporter ATP-binding protein [Spirochaetes bacterium GWD1_61_31]OHD42011.1 MAG: lipoprotein ABC transporter ATP-binding protein [Spirochaetes bacterium GWE1_60_18]OHD61722.1 MAG: lipoprotein ABC transporter ATP-binding protein [Spirochaetes bacterium GWF1_60_12]
MSEIIRCANIQKAYISDAETLQVLRSVNCSIEKGDTVSIMGPSGCGKSTLLSIIGGLDKADSGTLNVNGWNINEESEDTLSQFRASEVGFVFQFHYLLRDFTALENVMLPLFMLKNKRKLASEKASFLLDQVGLSERRHHVPAKMSGGERQRVAIARAMINDPAILLADEPTGNLDEANARVIEQVLFNLVETCRTTLVVVTHDKEMAAHSSRRFLMHEGEIFEQ